MEAKSLLYLQPAQQKTCKDKEEGEKRKKKNAVKAKPRMDNRPERQRTR
jgi:hypothetical protein